MLAFIRERTLAAGFDPLVIANIELACEEALVNIISYAYPQSTPGSIDILCNPSDPPGLIISIRDQGVPFDPLKREKVEKELGGYGVTLILKIMDQVQYAREEHDNILTLVKYLAPATKVNHG